MTQATNPDALMKIKIKNDDLQYVDVMINGKYYSVHGYLVGLEAALQFKKRNKYHNLILVTGKPGDGKSTFVQGMAALNANNAGGKLTLDNFSWKTKEIIEKTDREDNMETPQVWDEAIEGATARNMALTNEGNKLKVMVVTKRRKRHTYYFLIDEINEYAWKLIKLCDAWIHISSYMQQRGYFKCYVKRYNIKWLYYLFKYMNKTWDSPEVQAVFADCHGKFNDWTDEFIDEKEYENMKIEQTKQITKDDKISWSQQKVLAFYYWSQGLKIGQKDLALKVGVSQPTINGWIKEFRLIILKEE